MFEASTEPSSSPHLRPSLYIIYTNKTQQNHKTQHSHSLTVRPTEL